MARRIRRVFDKEDEKLFTTATATPLAYGTAVFVGGRLPGTLGSTVVSGLAPVAPVVGLTSNVAMTGIALRQLGKFKKVIKLKRK